MGVGCWYATRFEFLWIDLKNFLNLVRDEDVLAGNGGIYVEWIFGFLKTL